jgi:cytochrome c oxidase subunit 4
VANTHHSPDDHDHGIAHVAPVKVLLGTWGALMVLTVVTVLATKVDFGSSINLAIAMAIAVIKATLVILFFMHLAYDKLFHSVMVGGGLLAAGLFIAISLMDSGQYQQNLIWNPAAPPAAPYGPRPLPQ